MSIVIMGGEPIGKTATRRLLEQYGIAEKPAYRKRSKSDRKRNRANRWR